MFEKLRRPGRSLKEGRFKKLFSYFLFGLICLVFVFLVPMGSNLIGEGVLGYVGDEPIRAGEFRLVEENIQRYYQSRLDQADEDNYSKIQEEIRQRAKSEIVRMYLLVQGSLKNGFFLSDSELRSAIRSFSVFQKDGRFLYSRYLSYLKSQGLNPSRFEERIRKAKLVENWTAVFKKSVFSNELERQKRSQRYRYKVNFRYAVLNAGKIEEQNLEPFVKSGDLKEINRFLKKNDVDWEETGEFALLSAFGIPIVQNKNFMKVLINHLPKKGVIPQFIRQGDKIYVVHVRSFAEGAVNSKNKQLEDFLDRQFDKSLRLLDSWVDFQRQKIQVKLSDRI